MRILVVACFDERRRVMRSKVPYIYDFKSSHLKLRNSGLGGLNIKHKGLEGFLGKNRPTLNLLLLSVSLPLYTIELKV